MKLRFGIVAELQSITTTPHHERNKQKILRYRKESERKAMTLLIMTLCSGHPMSTPRGWVAGRHESEGVRVGRPGTRRRRACRQKSLADQTRPLRALLGSVWLDGPVRCDALFGVQAYRCCDLGLGTSAFLHWITLP